MICNNCWYLLLRVAEELQPLIVSISQRVTLSAPHLSPISLSSIFLRRTKNPLTQPSPHYNATLHEQASEGKEPIMAPTKALVKLSDYITIHHIAIILIY